MRVSLLYFNLFLKRVGIAALMFSLCRILFLIYNSELFPNYSFWDIILGIRFDLSAIAWIYLPFLVFQIAPFPVRKHKYYRIFLKVLFHISNTLCLALNLIDLEFYEFTLRRMTADILQIMGGGNDFFNLLPQFIKDYWSTILWFPLFIYFSNKLYNKTEPPEYPKKHQFLFQFTIFIVAFVLIVIGSRGGIQLRPINFITASQNTAPQNVPLVLNTPFAFMKSFNKEALKEKEYFAYEEVRHIFTPEQVLMSEHSFNSRNIVVIILESFSKEYIGWYNNGKGYTPFLDSLMNHSTVFTSAYANGKRSIEALPAIFSGIPNLMGEPYITSTYAGNKISSLNYILKKKDYTTSFFHGGSNGTMGFDAFAEISGFDNYFGRTEFDNEKYFDGNWGIYDQPFLSYTKKMLDTTSQPFLSSIFTLSSHHPYSIPDELKGKFPEGILPIHKTIGYTDHALRSFFLEAKEAHWYENSIFIITADHTAQSSTPFYTNLVGSYSIPIILFDPKQDTLSINSNITQHCDIQSIALTTLGYSNTFFGYGNNPFDQSNNSFCITLNNGIYQFIYQDNILHFDGSNSIGFFNLQQDSLLQNNLVNERSQILIKMERTVKAIIQSYNNRMIANKMYVGAYE